MGKPTYIPEYRQSWALLIGIDAYPSFPQLNTAVKGVDELAQVLTDELDFQPDRIIKLTNEHATQRAILKAIENPLSRQSNVGRDDRVLIYFAGHGVTFDTAEGPIGCIIPVDAEPDSIHTTIAMDDLTRQANRMYAKHVLFLLDACFSGFATTREVSAGVERQLDEFLTHPSRQVITAGDRDEAASDAWGPGGHSLFTGFLIEGLRGATPAPGGVLRAFHLAGYLQDQVAQHSRSLQTPQYAPLMGSSGGDFIFSVREVSELPNWITGAAQSANANQRLFAVGELRTLAQSEDSGKAAHALAILEQLSNTDPDTIVRASAQAVLQELRPKTEVKVVERQQPIVTVSEILPESAPPISLPNPRVELQQNPPSTKQRVSATRQMVRIPIWMLIAGAVSVALIVAGILTVPLPSWFSSSGTPTSTATSTEQPTPTASKTNTPTITPTDMPTLTRTPNLAATATLDLLQK